MSRRKKKKSLPAALFSALLTLIDILCEGLGAAFMAAVRLLGCALSALLRGLLWLVRALLRGLAQPFVWLWRMLTRGRRRAQQCLKLTGPEFEAYVALLLADHGYRDVEITKGSGDQGVDILCERNGKTYAVQCKNYEGSVGNFAVQEAYAGAQYYGCDAAVVVCPGEFTRGAKELARSTGVLLWDGERLSRMMQRSGRRPRHQKG